MIEIILNDSDFIEGDLVEVELTRLGHAVDDLLVEWTSEPPVKWEFSYRKVGEIK